MTARDLNLVGLVQDQLDLFQHAILFAETIE